MTKTQPVLSFAKLDQGMPMPHLLDIQTRAFQSLLQPDGKGAERTDVGLERVFKDVFPIQDVNGNYSLEFVKYGLGEPKRSEEHTSELQSRPHLVCRLLLEKKKNITQLPLVFQKKKHNKTLSS